MKKFIYELQSRSDFVCTGSDCERDCCHGWDQIAVDQDTITNWQETADEKTREFLVSLIDENSEHGPQLKSKNNAACIALNDERLCSVQLQYGHERLPDICRVFPRLDFENGKKVYRSASLSCPVIVEEALFKNENSLFKISEEGFNGDISSNSALHEALDEFMNEVLAVSGYSLGIKLFFIADMFSDIIQAIDLGGVSVYDIREATSNIDAYLSEIKKAQKANRIKANPVTSGSFWKSIYEYCYSRKINPEFLELEGAPLRRAVERCDSSFSSFGKIYSVIKKYKKKSSKFQGKQSDLFQKYVQMIFINKGFPLTERLPLPVLLVESMINMSLFQLLVWIEINKNGSLDEAFLKKCIVEVDRQSVLSDVITKGLESNSQMMQVDKYCNAFLDLF